MSDPTDHEFTGMVGRPTPTPFMVDLPGKAKMSCSCGWIGDGPDWESHTLGGNPHIIEIHSGMDENIRVTCRCKWEGPRTEFDEHQATAEWDYPGRRPYK